MSSIEQNLSDMTEERTKYLETKKWEKKVKYISILKLSNRH